MASLVFTTLNEGLTVGTLLEDILAQTRLPQDVVIVDGGSTDDTAEKIRGFTPVFAAKGVVLELVVVPGAGIAKGRNLAIERAKSQVIAVTDAGCRLDPRWLERITSPLEDGTATFVGGFFVATYESSFERALASLTTAPRPDAKFLPSSRSAAFLKDAWRTAGRYPEDLPWGEDTEFNKLLLATGARYVVQEAAVVHWRMRRSIQSAWKQHYRYAKGDGMARRRSVRYFILPLVFIASLAGSVIAWWIPPLVLLIFFLLAFLRKLDRIRPADYPRAFYLNAVLLTAAMCGYVVGLLRGRGRSP